MTTLTPPTTDGPLLSLVNVNKAFGGLLVTDNVSLEVRRGELVSIIGPNGAGKSTLFNQMTGYHRPDRGTITFDGESVIGRTPYDIVRMGIGRAFQRSNIFPRLTTRENIQAAVVSDQRRALRFFQRVADIGEVNDKTDSILLNIGLNDKRDRVAGKLALGDQKRLEIGLALALNPKLLLLDEPTAGMSPEETNNTVSLIERLVRDLNVTLLFTEHDMGLVFRISERMYVLNHGAIIAHGLPAEVAANPQVQEVYLGSSREKRTIGVRRDRSAQNAPTTKGADDAS